MNNSLLLILLASLLISCSEEDEDEALVPVAACGVNDSAQELPWLKEEIDRLSNTSDELLPYFYITQGIYEGQVVFVFENCCPFCNTTMPVYDCSGEILGQLANGIDRTDIEQVQLVFRPEGFACQTR